MDRVELSSGFLKSFLDSTKDLSPDERASKLEADEGLSTAHEESAQGGQTEAPSRDEKVDLHFVALVEKDGSLYELGNHHFFNSFSVYIVCHFQCFDFIGRWMMY